MKSTLKTHSLLAVAILATTTLNLRADKDDEGPKETQKAKNQATERKTKVEAKFKFNKLPIPAGSDFIQATAVNRNDWIVGYHGTLGDNHFKGYLLRNGRFTDVGLPSTPDFTVEGSIPLGVSTLGTVAGYATEEGTGLSRSYVRNGTNVRVLVYPDSRPSANQVWAVSTDGKVLASAQLDAAPFYLSYIYKDGVYSLPAVPPDSTYSGNFWAAINSKGDLLTSIVTDTGETRGVIGTPAGSRLLPPFPGSAPENISANPVALLDNGDAVFQVFDFGVVNPDFGGESFGLILHSGDWIKVRSPKDTAGFTTVYSAVLADSNEIKIVGNAYDIRTGQIEAYSAVCKLKD